MVFLGFKELASKYGLGNYYFLNPKANACSVSPEFSKFVSTRVDEVMTLKEIFKK